MKRTPVYKYDTEGNFLCKYESYNLAALDIDRTRPNIRKAIIKRNKCAGFFFSEIYLDKYPAAYKTPKVVLAYKKSDSSTWVECTSLKQASSKTNIPAVVIKWLLDENSRKITTIFKDLRGKIDLKNQISFYVEKSIGKPVPVLIQKGKSKKEFKSLKAAALFLKVHAYNVAAALKNKDKISGWSIKELK